MKSKMKTTTKLWIGLGILAILSPLGLLLPEWFNAGAAWGEWGAEELPDLVGYIPSGLGKLSSLWTAAMPDYAFAGSGNAGTGMLSGQYIASAVIGIALCIGLSLIIGKVLGKK